jgi:hypothetical protein
MSFVACFEVCVEYSVEESAFPLYNTTHFKGKYGKAFVAYPEMVLVERETNVLRSFTYQWKRRVNFVDPHKLDFEIIVARVQNVMQSIMLIEKALFACRFSLP